MKPRGNRLTLACGKCGHEHPTNIRVPLEVVSGHYDQLDDQALKELVRDLNHEVMRRNQTLREWLPNQ